MENLDKTMGPSPSMGIAVTLLGGLAPGDEGDDDWRVGAAGEPSELSVRGILFVVAQSGVENVDEDDDFLIEARNKKHVAFLPRGDQARRLHQQQGQRRRSNGQPAVPPIRRRDREFHDTDTYPIGVMRPHKVEHSTS